MMVFYCFFCNAEVTNRMSPSCLMPLFALEQRARPVPPLVWYRRRNRSNHSLQQALLHPGCYQVQVSWCIASTANNKMVRICWPCWPGSLVVNRLLLCWCSFGVYGVTANWTFFVWKGIAHRHRICLLLYACMDGWIPSVQRAWSCVSHLRRERDIRFC